METEVKGLKMIDNETAFFFRQGGVGWGGES